MSIAKLVKDTPKPFAFWLSLIVSVGLIVASFCVPPYAVIDGSVLAAVGELFAFAALGILYRAIEMGIAAKVTHGDTSLAIGEAATRTDEVMLPTETEV